MLDKNFLIQPTVDVFISPTDISNSEKVLVTFSKMTTRERIEIITSKNIAEFLALLNGIDSVQVILDKMGFFSKVEAIKLLDFLLSKHLITDVNLLEESEPRYSRQSTYFHDMFLDRSGTATQELIGSKKIVLLGCGAVGSQIVEILVRAGIRKVVLVDYKSISQSNLETHLYSRLKDIGTQKVIILKNYLNRINSSIEIDIFNDKLLPNTELSKWINDDVSLVINSCDEPYIGHTSLKVGRYLHSRNIPLYVAGGFDAHLMSSGELLYPPKTPCIDCAQQTFSLALEGWKPVYNQTNINSSIVDKSIENINPNVELFSSYDKTSFLAGGPGGLIMMSGFSANLSAIKIIRFLAEDSSYDFNCIRYEYLPNDGELTEVEMIKQANCNVCKS